MIHLRALGGVMLAASISLAASSVKELDFHGPRAMVMLRTTFADFGVSAKQKVLRDREGVRLWASKVSNGQVGVYSLFHLSGDCEVVVAYDLVTLPAVKKGYGSGIGLAFDLGESVGRGTIQRVEKPKEGPGYVLQTNLVGASPAEEYRFVKAKARQGWLGLRREKDVLVFLTADDLSQEAREIDRLPFPTQTVRAVRLFADTGGSPTVVDARMQQIRVRADEITGGVPEAEKSSTWWWALGGVVALGVAVWLGLRGRR